MDLKREVLKDEDKIGFHVCINPFYDETAHFADMVLPWTTYLERWELDARGAYNLKPCVSVRWPVAAPLGEAKDVREIVPELARRMGAFEDPEQRPYFEPYLEPLTDEELAGAETNENTRIVTQDGRGIGIWVNGVAVCGFRTPSRKFEMHSEFVVKTARNEDTTALTALANSKGRNRAPHHEGHEYELYSWPVFELPEEHRDLDEDPLVMTSFKWCVHNHGRTANLEWCSEIVHSNPAWLHPDTAARLGLKNGDWIEITGSRSTTLHKAMPTLGLGDGERKLQLPIVITRGVHPDAIAISLGRDQLHACGAGPPQ